MQLLYRGMFGFKHIVALCLPRTARLNVVLLSSLPRVTLQTYCPLSDSSAAVMVSVAIPSIVVVLLRKSHGN